MIRVEVTEKEIELPLILEFFKEPAHGATVLFTGVVRAVNAGKPVLAVSYDVFDSLAEKTLLQICLEAQESTKESLRIVVVHRKGKLRVGDISVVVGVSSPHRAESFEAARTIIEQIKAKAPIWKKEHYEDGETEWLRGHALCRSPLTPPLFQRGENFPTPPFLKGGEGGFS